MLTKEYLTTRKVRKYASFEVSDYLFDNYKQRIIAKIRLFVTIKLPAYFCISLLLRRYFNRKTVCFPLFLFITAFNSDNNCRNQQHDDNNV